MPLRYLALFLLVPPSLCVAQDAYTLSGTVADAATGEHLAAANIRVFHTSQGTIANANGTFALRLSAGRHTLLVSMLGYTTDTLDVEMNADRSADVRLRPAEITLPEVVVTAEDPAIAIMRKVIAQKHIWSDKLISYEFDAFNRQVLLRDTAIAGISETFTKGTWQVGDTLREVITHKRQTENVPAAQNFASVGRILNFYDDEIRFIGYTFTGPTSPDAFDYYTFRLVKTGRAGGREMHTIALTPRVRTSPLFTGTLEIAGDSYALAGVDVRPNEAFQIPFVKEKSLRYRQQFALYDSTFWMPVDIRIDGSFKVSIVGFDIPKFGLEQTSVITSYTINPVIPDSLLHAPRLRTDSLASRRDTSFWATQVVLPLSAAEQVAYTRLDSTQTFDKQFKPKGALSALNDASGSSGSILSVLDVHFNRVEGFHLGLRKEFDSLTTQTSLTVGAAYSTSKKYWSHTLGVTLFTAKARSLGFGGEWYRGIRNAPDWGYYEAFSNSFSALFDKEDYRDYYAAQGWRAFVIARLLPKVKTEGSYINEQNFTATQTTDYSLLSRSRSYRPNPAIAEGNLRSLQLSVRWGNEEIPLGLIAQDALTVSIEHSTPNVLGSAFEFTRYEGVAEYGVVTWGRGFLLKPMLRVRLAAGGSSGTLPQQRIFGIESQLSGYAPFGVMKALPVRALTGEGYAAVSLEHNFRSIPFLALGIPFLYENNIEVLAHGGAARVWRGSARSDEPMYYEAGFGFSRIFDILRTDFTWRLSGPGGFRFSLGISTLL